MNKKNFGMVRRERHSSEGNGSLLIVVNSVGSYWEWSIVDETVLAALEHFGMPYRVHDLAEESLDKDKLSDCAAIVLAQNRVSKFISTKEARLISDAVKSGTGFVSFDSDIRYYPDPLIEIFGFKRINPHPYATDLLRICNNEHYISNMQNDGEYHKFDRMVTAVAAEKWKKNVVPLAEGVLGKEQLVYIRHVAPYSAFEPGNFPVVFAAGWGKGKAVQFTINPRIWRNGFYGHARGLDDLFWRSIIWTVRKPFAANMIPHFVTMSFDDCSGIYDFKYVDLAVKFGYVPMPSLLLRNVEEELFPKIKSGIESGKVEYNSHALDYHNLLYSHYGKGDCTREELEHNFAVDDAFWKKVGAEPGTTIRFHMGDCGVNSLPFLKERGRLFFCPALQTGLLKSEMCMDDGYWPYNLQNFYYDRLPDDNDFYAFASMQKRHQEDFLSGCTTTRRESEHNDMEKAAQNAWRLIQLGLRSGFFSEILTHEQKFKSMSLAEWESILKRVDQLTKGYEMIHCGHDKIGNYLKGKDSVFIRSSKICDGNIQIGIKGQTDVPLKVSVFNDSGKTVTHEYMDIEKFSGELYR